MIPAEQVSCLAGFDAVVLGSAVYMGHWLAPARDLAERLGREAAGRPVWLFSSGPLGDPPKPEQDPVDVAPLVAATGARAHRVFAGRLMRSQLSFPERAVTAALRVADRDDRDWTRIAEWAHQIAAALSAETTRSST
jgi:menaquinone-dependent protoporphyrinogen oxidase